MIVDKLLSNYKQNPTRICEVWITGVLEITVQNDKEESVRLAKIILTIVCVARQIILKEEPGQSRDEAVRREAYLIGLDQREIVINSFIRKHDYESNRSGETGTIRPSSNSIANVDRSGESGSETTTFSDSASTTLNDEEGEYTQENQLTANTAAFDWFPVFIFVGLLCLALLVAIYVLRRRS